MNSCCSFSRSSFSAAFFSLSYPVMMKLSTSDISHMHPLFLHLLLQFLFHLLHLCQRSCFFFCFLLSNLGLFMASWRAGLITQNLLLLLSLRLKILLFFLFFLLQKLLEFDCIFNLLRPTSHHPGSTRPSLACTAAATSHSFSSSSAFNLSAAWIAACCSSASWFCKAVNNMLTTTRRWNLTLDVLDHIGAITLPLRCF